MRPTGWICWVLLAALGFSWSAEVPVRAEEGPGQLAGRLWDRLGRFRLRDENERNHRLVVSAFRDVTHGARQSTVRIYSQHRPVALGTVVDEGGLILTKASELAGELVCLTSDGRRLPATVAAEDRDYDLALLKTASDKLTPISWSATVPRVGAWLVTPGIDDNPHAIGVVSASIRHLPPARAVLGVRLEPTDVGPRILEIVPQSSAADAALEIGDVILRLNGQLVGSPQAVSQTIGGFRPGERVELVVQRGATELSIMALLGEFSTLGNEQAAIMESLAGPLSTRRSGFPVILQHDSVLQPVECGGPLLDLDGRAVGINIARASRVASYAIPAAAVQELVERLQSDLIAQEGVGVNLQNASASP